MRLKESADDISFPSTSSASVQNNVNAAYDVGNGVLDEDVIYPVTEDCNSDYIRQACKTSFNRFMKVINIHDLQVLHDLGPKIMEQMVIKFVINARDVKNLPCASITSRM
ncbi:MAG: hypothetical protein ACRD8Z_00620 [Nitrososphaeraceae archaeon]